MSPIDFFAILMPKRNQMKILLSIHYLAWLTLSALLFGIGEFLSMNVGTSSDILDMLE